ncbi:MULTISPECIES: hypothetical protein [unclassified Gilliamella]|uniref:hypothetical protein n=1 Tax=unclassified Gilliamella TaxID=2685620 RepID=UPI00226ACFC5|nr:MULTISPECIES: hypothetical protein [unclassified Gilliamella]MCX8598408.1 hypothetical protein [Gilliamella sp. B3486]MCX8688441.1 hypothetical protein [Gilliamella sp. B2973]MCX8704395.1 hypothetical protein [Gilliamella sp. B3127]
MNIEDKIALSKRPVQFIAEGNFLKLYNQSLYVVQQLLGFNLKATAKYIKKIDEIIICGGFPTRSITKRYPNASPNLTGYELLGNYDLSGYELWYQKHCQIPKQKTPQSLLTAFQEINEQLNEFRDMNKPLTVQHLLFLQSWQANKYPAMVDSAFIQELKNYFSELH